MCIRVHHTQLSFADSAFLQSPCCKPRYIDTCLGVLNGNTFLLLVFGFVAYFRDVSVISMSWRDFFSVTFIVLTDPVEPHAELWKHQGIVWTYFSSSFFFIFFSFTFLTFFSSLLSFPVMTETWLMVHKEISNSLTNGVRASS